MPRSTPELRELWSAFECNEARMATIDFGPDRIRVAPPTAEGWRALAAVLAHHGYVIRREDTDSYNCRTITGGAGRSLHSFGIALDINWKTNPWRDHDGTRPPRFSDKPTQEARALDVKHVLADTDMTREMIADALAIKTVGGLRVFEWGGNWQGVKDAMHFEIDLSPAELTAIDWNTVAGASGGDAAPEPRPVARYSATKQHVKNRGVPSDAFLDELVAWGRSAPSDIFDRNDRSDIYSSVKNVLGPWTGLEHRRAVMLEVMRVLGGFESSWDWNEGRDVTNSTSITPETIEAGLWQVSANAMNFGPELKELVQSKVGSLDGNAFQAAMKSDHALAMEFVARLLRRTVAHHGPVLRHEIDPWLRRDAVDEFQQLLS